MAGAKLTKEPNGEKKAWPWFPFLIGATSTGETMRYFHWRLQLHLTGNVQPNARSKYPIILPMDVEHRTCEAYAYLQAVVGCSCSIRLSPAAVPLTRKPRQEMRRCDNRNLPLSAVLESKP